MLRFLILLVLLTAPAYAQDAREWAVYTNVRYEYSICYPADLLVAQGESDNADGQVFLGSDGANLRVYASYNAADQTLADAYQQAKTDAGDIAYKRLAQDWFAVSGTKDDEITYTRTILDHDQFTTFRLTYPTQKADTYNPLVEPILECFKTL